MFGDANVPISRKIFDKHDTDKSGSISPEELKAMCHELGHHLSDEEFALALAKLDTNDDHKITVHVPGKDVLASFDIHGRFPGETRGRRAVVDFQHVWCLSAPSNTSIISCCACATLCLRSSPPST